MNKVFLFIGVSFFACSAQAQDIFKKHGFDKETLTLSKGRYEEVFTNKEVVQIGSVLLNTKTNKVVKFLDEETEDVSFKAEYSSRWLSPDPLAEKYPQLSPYVFCGNNPINNVDLRGDSITTVINSTITNPDGTTRIQSDSYYYGQDANGNYGFIGSNGQIYSGNDTYVNSLTTALNDLRTGGDVGKGLVSDLASSTKTVQIAQGRNTADPNGTYIKWNPNSTNGGPDQNGGTTRPAYIGLGHEMAHTQDVWNGTYDSNTWSGNIPNAEKYSTHVENQLRAEHGLPLRTNYAITPTGAGDPSTQILITGTRLSSFYKTTVFIGGIPVIIPYIYKR